MKRTACMILALAFASFLAAEDKKALVLFQAGLAKETVQGDLRAAIQMYGNVLKEAGRDRALAAKALLRMAECYRKLGDTEARKIYERVVREFGDQTQAAATASGQLGTAGAEAATRRVW